MALILCRCVCVGASLVLNPASFVGFSEHWGSAHHWDCHYKIDIVSAG